MISQTIGSTVLAQQDNLFAFRRRSASFASLCVPTASYDGAQKLRFAFRRRSAGFASDCARTASYVAAQDLDDPRGQGEAGAKIVNVVDTYPKELHQSLGILLMQLPDLLFSRVIYSRHFDLLPH